MFLELEIEAKMCVVCPYNFPIGFPLVLSAAQMACSFPLAKCWLLQALQNAEFPSLPLFVVVGFLVFFLFLCFGLAKVFGVFSVLDLLGALGGLVVCFFGVFFGL